MAPNYGHTSHGINLTNYRLLAQANERKTPPGAYVSSTSWKLETKDHVGLSNNENLQSASLRQTGTLLQAAAADLVVTDLNSVESALRSKLGQTETLKAKLEHCLVEVETEIAACNVVKGQLEERLMKVEAKASVNSNRLKVRKSRPNRERTMDDVERSLLSQKQLVVVFGDKVRRAVAHIDKEISQLLAVKARLEADLRDKNDALDVDTAVLGIGPNGEVAEVPRGKRGDYAFKTPHTWVRSTQENLAHAQHWLTDAARLRKAIRHAMQSARQVEHEVSHGLNSALGSKLNSTKQLKTQLEAQLAKVTDETARANQQRSQLVAALEAKRGPLAQAKERWAMRKARPDRETVQDEVEAALTREIAHLNAVTSQLSTKVSNVDKELDALALASAMLEDNLRDKETALTLDEQCAMMDGRINVYAPPPSSIVSAPVSTGSAARSATLRRIAELENELTAARRERESLETSMKGIRETITRGGASSRPVSAYVQPASAYLTP